MGKNLPFRWSTLIGAAFGGAAGCAFVAIHAYEVGMVRYHIVAAFLLILFGTIFGLFLASTYRFIRRLGHDRRDAFVTVIVVLLMAMLLIEFVGWCLGSKAAREASGFALNSDGSTVK